MKNLDLKQHLNQKFKMKGIIKSILDTDLYKLTMQMAVVKKFPYAKVRYAFINRGGTQFPEGFAEELRVQVKLMEKLSGFLAQYGFNVEGIQKVTYHQRDVRYFHDEDKQGALLLHKHLTEFITPFTDSKNINIRIINLSSKFPNAQKKALELWVNL